MIHPTKKIILATLMMAVGWGLSWPFRKATFSPMVPVTNLGERTSWSDIPPGGKTTSQPTAVASAAKIPGTLIHNTTHAASHASYGENPLTAERPSLQTYSRRRSIDQPRLRQAARPMGLSQPSLPPRLTATTPDVPRSPMPSVPAAADPTTPNPTTPAPTSQTPARLPAHMPNHYEPEYSFSKNREPGRQGSDPLPEDARPHPAYTTAGGNLATAGNITSRWPHEILHEVQNSDTLEKLARHYLGDPARALEIFDLNRDKLKNPELLPIGAELRIPTSAHQIAD